MSFLLDTHALLWWLLDDRRLPQVARDAIRPAATRVFFSPVNVYELMFKAKRGRLDLAPALFADFTSRLTAVRLGELPVSAEHAARAALLDIEHRDPFDRVLVAQALVEGMTIISNERLFDATGVDRLWN